MPWFLVLWPYLLAAAAALWWLALLHRRIERKLQFIIVAFVACALANMVIEFACTYLVPLDIAGTPPPDPRNARLRFLITAAIQVPISLVLAYYVAPRTRVDRWQEP
jgi:hypothetical protein